MHILAVGMNHKTAPIEMRERLALVEANRGQVLQALHQLQAVDEAVVLSTCNRLEVYAAVTSYHEAMENLVDLLAHYSQIPAEELMPYLYVHSHHQSARHLFRVACGLDSMVLGETQILGQVRDAYQMATESGTVGKFLHELFQRALRVAKKAHSETAISRHAASISSAAVQLMQEQLGSLEDAGVMVVGAGEMARLAAENLESAGPRLLIFANRTPERAQQLASEYGGIGISLADMPGALRQVQGVIVSTASPDYVVTVPVVQAALEERAEQDRDKPLVIVDIAVPRNVEPAVADLSGVALYHIDHLQLVVADSLRQREREVPKVEAMIRDEVASYNLWLRQQEVVPLIRSLRQKGEQIRRAEVQRLFDRLPQLDSHTREMIEITTQSIVNKILNEPTVRLRASVSYDQGDVYAQALADLFNLTPAITGRERVP